ncbi:MAG: hypothetical protein WCJ64_06015 [Rhodospirillaceae bacterium]
MTIFYGHLADLASLILFHIQKEEVGIISRLPMLLGPEECQELASADAAFLKRPS